MLSLPFNRKLGHTDVVVPALGLGCMGLSQGIYASSDDEASFKVLKHAVAIGCTFWDSADYYGVGHNEELIGKVFKEPGLREKVCLSLKFGVTGDLRAGTARMCGEPGYVKEACEKSLKALGTDYIDLYTLGRKDPKVDIEVTVAAMAELVKEGKVKYLGLSEVSAETLRKAHKVHPITALQIEYSPWTLDIEHNGVLAACRELGITIVAYSPLGRGFLTGQLKSLEDIPEDDMRRRFPRFQGENFYKNLEIVDKLNAIAKVKGCKVTQLVLAWIMAQGEEFVVIPGTRKIKYLDENFDARNIKLTEAEMKQIREVSENAEVAGERYPVSTMHNLDE